MPVARYVALWCAARALEEEYEIRDAILIPANVGYQYHELCPKEGVLIRTTMVIVVWSLTVFSCFASSISQADCMLSLLAMCARLGVAETGSTAWLYRLSPALISVCLHDLLCVAEERLLCSSYCASELYLRS